MIRLTRFVAAAAISVLFSPSAARKTTAPQLPKVVSAAVPFYPRTAPSARIQGIVTLRLSTDGRRVSSFDSETGPPMLLQAAKENVKTWMFAPHAHASFEATFRYRLLEVDCDPNCRCESKEKESVLLQLPINIEVSAKVPAICDPAVEVPREK